MSETQISDTEKALNYYRSAFEGKRPDYVPARIQLLRRVRPDFPFFLTESPDYCADAGEHDCESNPNGALSVRAKNGKMLGVKPGEFEAVAWRENTP